MLDTLDVVDHPTSVRSRVRVNDTTFGLPVLIDVRVVVARVFRSSRRVDPFAFERDLGGSSPITTLSWPHEVDWLEPNAERSDVEAMTE